MSGRLTHRPVFESGHRRGGGETTAEALTDLSDLATGRVLDLAGAGGRLLLGQLACHAPGTLMHSLRVARLVALVDDRPEVCAAILLHDCGKLVAPLAFAENQLAGSPRPPGTTILGHVTAGLVLAAAAGLAPMTRQAIAEHHGTLPAGLCMRYPGPAPTQRWTQTLMLADCFEALHAQGRLTETMAERLVAERVGYRQLPAAVALELGPLLLAACQQQR